MKILESIRTISAVILASYIAILACRLDDQQHAQTIAQQQTAASMALIAKELAPLQIDEGSLRTLDEASKPRGKR